MRKKIIILTVMLLTFSLPLIAKERGIKINGTLGKNTSSIIVQAEGIALLGENDTPNQARMNALLQAKRNAAEAVLTKITSNTTVKDFVLTEDIITAKSKADVTVLEQENLPTINNEYKVKIKAEVRIDETPEKKTEITTIDSDKPLKIIVWTPKTTYKNGEKLSFSILTTKDSYIVVRYTMSDGSSLQLFPNEYWNDNFVRGSETLNIPSDKIKTFDLEVSEPFGIEKLNVYASSAKIEKVPNSESRTRGIRINAKKGYEEFSEASLEIITSD